MIPDWWLAPGVILSVSCLLFGVAMGLTAVDLRGYGRRSHARWALVWFGLALAALIAWPLVIVVGIARALLWLIKEASA